MYARIYLYIYIYICTYICNIYIHTYIHTYIYIYMCVCVCVCVPEYVRVCVFKMNWKRVDIQLDKKKETFKYIWNVFNHSSYPKRLPASLTHLSLHPQTQTHLSAQFFSPFWTPLLKSLSSLLPCCRNCFAIAFLKLWRWIQPIWKEEEYGYPLPLGAAIEGRVSSVMARRTLSSGW